MRSVLRTVYGPPSVLSVGEAPTPQPGAAQLLVRVRATTVSRTDCGLLQAEPPLIRLFSGLRRPRRSVPGSDFAGEVVQVGSEVTRYQVGDRIWGFDDRGLSSQAQYLVVGEDAPLARIPSAIDFATAAASGEGAHYALAFLKRSGYRPGNDACVYGATGAIGSALVQLLADQGSEVVAFCPGEHVDLVKGLGANVVYDYTTHPTSQVHGTFDYVFDAVGKLPYSQAAHLLSPHGRFASSELGPRGQNLYLTLTTRLRKGPKVDFPVPGNLRNTVEQVSQMLADGRFHPVIDRHFPMEQVVSAYEYVLSGSKVGNVILDIP